MSSTGLLLISMISLIIWIAVSKKLMNTTKHLNKQKLLALVGIGLLTTFIITFSFIQKLIA
ncbi:MAG: hypothetical protein ACI4XN_07380 [Candidatus Kurthia intestinigallinarum]